MICVCEDIIMIRFSWFFLGKTQTLSFSLETPWKIIGLFFPLLYSQLKPIFSFVDILMLKYEYVRVGNEPQWALTFNSSSGGDDIPFSSYPWDTKIT